MGCCHQYFANTPEGDDAFVIDAARMVFGAGCLKEAGAHAKAQGLTRDLWDNTFDTMLAKHRMPPVKPAERAEILDYLAEQFPPRRRGRGADNPFLK